MGYYDVALLAGYKVTHHSDSLKEDNVHKSFESHSKSFKTVILVFLVLVEHYFLRNLRGSKRDGSKHVQYLFVYIPHVFSLTRSQN